MSELSPRARAFLKAHRNDGVPTAGDAARVQAALATTLAGVAKAAAPAGAAAGASSIALSSLVKVGVVATLVGVVAGVGIRTALRPAPAAPVAVARVTAARPAIQASARPAPPIDPEPPAQEPPPAIPAPVPVPVPSTPLPSTPRAVVADPRPPSKLVDAEAAQEVEPVPVARPPLPLAPAPISPPAAPAVSLAEDEVRLVSEAQEFLRRGKAREALSVLERWEATFGETGQLTQEAHAARIVALCASGQVEPGREGARRYFVEFPGSPHKNRIERACAAQ